MKVLIVEDERLAAQKLIRLLGEIDGSIQVVDILKSVEEAVNWFLKNTAPDLIFMDIQLEDGLCFEIFENCRINTPVVFTTAYDEYVLKAFKVNSVDYLLKPVALGDLENAIRKFNRFYQVRSDKTAMETIVTQWQPQIKERFLIRIGEHYKSIPVTEIAAFYIMERSVFLFTNSGKSYPIDYSLDRIELLVDSKVFFRVSRNFIVHYSAIRDMIAYSSNRLKLLLAHWTGAEDVVVSRERVAAFKEWMNR